MCVGPTPPPFHESFGLHTPGLHAVPVFQEIANELQPGRGSIVLLGLFGGPPPNMMCLGTQWFQLRSALLSSPSLLIFLSPPLFARRTSKTSSFAMTWSIL